MKIWVDLYHLKRNISLKILPIQSYYNYQQLFYGKSYIFLIFCCKFIKFNGNKCILNWLLRWLCFSSWLQNDGIFINIFICYLWTEIVSVFGVDSVNFGSLPWWHTLKNIENYGLNSAPKTPLKCPSRVIFITEHISCRGHQSFFHSGYYSSKYRVWYFIVLQLFCTSLSREHWIGFYSLLVVRCI